MVSCGFLRTRLGLYSTAAALCLPHCLALNILQIDTTVGRVFGLVNGTFPRVAQFLGIPYAEPPVGDLRWERSVAKSPVAEIDATRFSPSCPQYDTSIPSVYEIDAREFLVSGPTSENCLTVSVWAPFNSENCTEQLPVVVWYYGGGQLTGGAQIEYQIPTPWVERTSSHIVVQVNYRLNVFGYPKANGMGQILNLGLLDQRLGLEWVRSNIANFGGDPSKITLWGQSAGASSVDFLNFAYPEDPIAKGIILDSSSSLSNAISTSPGNSFTVLAGHFECGNLSAADEFACMKKVDFTAIESFLKSYQDAGTTPTITFGPIADNVTAFANYTERFFAGNFSKVPAILGTNNNEGSSLTTWTLNGTTYNLTLANANTVTRACVAQQNLHYRYLQNTTSYRYYYTGNWSNISPRPWEGAYHSSELPMIFGTHDEFRNPSSDFEYTVSHRMQDLWLAFMRDPINGPKDLGWPMYTPGGGGIEFAWDNMVDQVFDTGRFDTNCYTNWTAIPGSTPPDHAE